MHRTFATSLSEASLHRNIPSSDALITRASCSDETLTALGIGVGASSVGAAMKRVSTLMSVEDILSEHAGGRIAPPAWVVRCMHLQEEHYQKRMALAEETERRAALQASWTKERLMEAERALAAPGAILQRYEEQRMGEQVVREQSAFEVSALQEALGAAEARLQDLERLNANGAEEVSC